MKKVQSSIVMAIVISLAANIAQAEFSVGVGLSNNQVQPEFNQLITFEPDMTSQRYHLITQERKGRTASLGLSVSVQEDYLDGFLTMGLATRFTLGFSGVSGQFTERNGSQLDWKLGPLTQYGLEARFAIKPVAWSTGTFKRGVYCSIGSDIASADFTIRADNVPFSDSADGRVATLGCGFELTRQSNRWDFGIRRTMGFLDSRVETRQISAIRSLEYEFDIDSWGIGATYNRRIGGSK